MEKNKYSYLLEPIYEGLIKAIKRDSSEWGIAQQVDLDTFRSLLNLDKKILYRLINNTYHFSRDFLTEEELKYRDTEKYRLYALVIVDEKGHTIENFRWIEGEAIPTEEEMEKYPFLKLFF